MGMFSLLQRSKLCSLRRFGKKKSSKPVQIDSTSLATLHIHVPKLPHRLMSGPLPTVEFSQNLVSMFRETDCVSVLTDISKNKSFFISSYVRVWAA